MIKIYIQSCATECTGDLKPGSKKICIDKDVVINVLCVVFVMLVVWINGKFLFQVCRVYGDSMRPTYFNSDTVLVNKFDKVYERNDIIVFNCCNDVFIKRVVGVPGDKIQIIDGILYVNDDKCELIDDSEIEYEGIAAEPVILDTDEYFVLGDNHENSMDSRYSEVGPVHINDVVGRVIMKIM